MCSKNRKVSDILSKEILDDLINHKKISYEEIGRMFECTGNNIKRVAKKYDIQLPQKRIINPCETFNYIGKSKYCIYCGNDITNRSAEKYCTMNCQVSYLQKIRYEKYLNGDLDMQRGNYNCSWLKQIIMREQNNRCLICNCEAYHNNKPLIFILDHIDGDAANNIRSNLRLVCPNCDTQLDTYKSKNKNGARSYYRYNKNNGGILGKC